MEKERKIIRVIKSKPTIEGAGVHLKRAFGFNEVYSFDPFLLLDDFRSNDPKHYLPGFPWHPHRGIETITYVLEGSVEHRDSMGNSGVIGAGDVQWMTAGSGIIHQEMPRGDMESGMGGFQLWANLPSSHKMMDPRYQEVKKDQIPKITVKSGVSVKIISGEVNGIKGPVVDIVSDPEYLDVTLASGKEFIHSIPPGRNVFAYCIDGRALFCHGKNALDHKVKTVEFFDGDASRVISDGSLVLFGDGEQVTVTTKEDTVRFLLISGKPIGEPIAWNGPIVMNTQEELKAAFEEYSNGTFIKAYQG